MASLARPARTRSSLRVLACLAVLLGYAGSLAAQGAPTASSGAVATPSTSEVLHTVEPGETLWDIARAYGVSMQAVLDANNLTEDDAKRLREDMTLRVPGAKGPAQPKKPRKARAGVTHELQAGETVWDIARAFSVSVREIMLANGLSEDEATKLREGKRLFLPGVEDDGRGRIRPKPRASDRRAAALAKKLGLGTRQVAGQLLHGRVDSSWSRAAERAGRFSGTLRWPVQNGAYVRGFGSGAGGYHKAMDIMGHIGWNVRAAAPGIVGYAGDEIPGFGNMVMLVHAGGFVTLYAHNSVNFVKAGELVQRGAIIAEVGSTGRSKGPHVHFELMYKNQNCDPAPLFRPGVKHKNGKLARIAYATWKQGGKRPKQVKCERRMRHPQSQWVVNEDPEREATEMPEDPSAPDPEREPPAEENGQP